MEKHEILGSMPTTALWNCEMDEIQRMDKWDLNTGQYLMNIHHII